MIGQLKGTVVSLGADTALIDVMGVGYEIYAAPRLLQKLAPGEAAVIAIETLVREDMIRLYGFETPAERQCFRLLQSVQGVGAKSALAILQILPPAELYDAVAAQDVTAISRAHGIGKKIAQRIATELHSKVSAGATGEVLTIAARTKARAAPADPALAARADAVSALANLGYEGLDARRAVALAAEGVDSPGVEVLIKAALKQLAA